MFWKRAFTGITLGVLTACSFASAPTLLGQISLNLVAYSNPEGTFEWQIANTNVDIYTYCFSTNNYIGGNPQVFNVWSIAGSSASDITASGILNNNNMPGLTSTHFLEAAAEAESYGSSYGITTLDDTHNASIHNTETNGDPSYDSLDYSNFYYLQQANQDGSGQPQGFVGPPPQHLTPEPTSMVALGIGAVGLMRRRLKK